MPSDIPVFVKILGQKDSSFNAVLGQVKKDLKDTAGEVVDFGLKGTAALAGASLALSALAVSAVKTAGKFEQLEAQLRGVARNAEQAKAIFADSVKLAGATPFGVEGIVAASVKLTAFGLSARQVLPQVADLASAFGTRVEDTATVIGKALSGSLEGFESLRNEYGISNAELKKFGATLTSTGGISLKTADEVARAGEALRGIITSNYGGAAAEASHTLTGAFSNVEDSVQRLSAGFGKTLIPLATLGAKSLSSMADTIDGIPASMKGAISGGVVLTAGLLGMAAAAKGFGTAGAALYATMLALGNRVPALTGTMLRLTTAVDGAAAGTSTFGRAIGFLGPAMTVATGAAIAGQVAIALWEQSLINAGKALEAQSKSFQSSQNQFKFWRDGLNEAAKGTGIVVETSGDLAKTTEQVGKAFAKLPAGEIVQQFERLGVTYKSANDDLAQNASRLETVNEQYKRLDGYLKNLKTGPGVETIGLDATIKDLFPDAGTTITLEELRVKAGGLKDELTKLQSAKPIVEGVVKAFTDFERPLAAVLERSKKLDTFLSFTAQAKDAESLTRNLKEVNAALADLQAKAGGAGLPTGRNEILKDLLTAEGTRAEVGKRQLALLDRQAQAEAAVYAQRRSLEDETQTQIERRAAREEAGRDVRLDGQRAELEAAIKSADEILKVREGALKEEDRLQKRLNALRNRKQENNVPQLVAQTEAELEVDRKASDRFLAAKRAKQSAEKQLLQRDVSDAQQALGEQTRAALDSVQDLQEQSGVTAGNVVKAYDGPLQQLQAWKTANQDLINQAPELAKAYDAAQRQLEAGQRSARDKQKGENLTSIQEQIALNSAQALTGAQRLLAVESGIVALERAKAQGLVDSVSAQKQITQLKTQELDLARAIVAQQAQDKAEVQSLKVQGIDEELAILQQRQDAGEKVEAALKAKRQERLQAALDAIEAEYQAEAVNEDRQEIAAQRRKFKIDSLLRGEYLAYVQKQQQTEQAEQAHQERMADIGNRVGGARSPLRSFEEAFGDSTGLEFSGVDQARFGRSALNADASPFRAPRKIPSPAEFAAKSGLNNPATVQTIKTLEKSATQNVGPTYNVNFNVDAVPPNVAELARQVATLIGREAEQKTFVQGRNTPKTKR